MSDYRLDRVRRLGDAEVARRERIFAAKPAEDESDQAIDWLMAVRKFGLEKASEMFP